MTSRKEEERNEKIIRGLMKLPPNRRCINCNSLGPHREFTHRVKSVSMSKFTSQEVEALQKGGTQVQGSPNFFYSPLGLTYLLTRDWRRRARDIFLTDWDPQRQRLPDSSNVEKVRDFIKTVYVDKRYAAGKISDKPPRDMQNLQNHEDETRRASSYHSYSQSPPYDFQYEERRYGKLAPTLTRKPGSDRGIYERKFHSFMSPSRLSDHIYEDRFANEGSNPRVSDYSLSSGGDPFRSDTQSPTFQRDIGFSSPSSETSRDILIEAERQLKVNTFFDTNAKKDADRLPRPQRTTSSGSFGSVNSNSISFKSVTSVSSVALSVEPEQWVGANQNKLYTFPSLPRSSVSRNSDGFDVLTGLYVPQTVASTTPAIDLFQLAETPLNVAVNFFEPSQISHQQSQSSLSSSLDCPSNMAQQQSGKTLNGNSPDEVIQKNEGWATFDTPQHIEPTPAPSTDEIFLGKYDQHLPLNTAPQWSSLQDATVHEPSSTTHTEWHDGLLKVEASINTTSSQSWNAFTDSAGHLPIQSFQQQSKEQVAVHNPPYVADQYLDLKVSEGCVNSRNQGASIANGPPIFGVPSHAAMAYTSSAFPVLAGAQIHGLERKSSNPFDHPYDFDLESSNMFMDMSSLQAALPNDQMPASFIGGPTQPWFPQEPGSTYMSAEPQGALGFMAGQAPRPQIT
ncbi:hypothetical protein RJ640_002495 [Escallonia rubra]|uniref:ADP-ribosylation factor GTPase-activating protein AGD14 n=1 Tax=Escallonia rubra TaxID=112253 RepID=A0AA88SDZ9_9ASTE|nr:hypothetical protein RJ640_002495 [Escallonia rubra]